MPVTIDRVRHLVARGASVDPINVRVVLDALEQAQRSAAIERNTSHQAEVRVEILESMFRELRRAAGQAISRSPAAMRTFLETLRDTELPKPKE